MLSPRHSRWLPFQTDYSSHLRLMLTLMLTLKHRKWFVNGHFNIQDYELIFIIRLDIF
ncbi:hypothetical protein HMPREF9103_00655 [Lentilactobacillus parafarraginis F0439]|uniref:Uncharacterized protein n=1 Tax=Lentilactobacillus parafarraginis F0439 TaxID=797515 RepID=G9ZLQ8_9LACO|nr:hypothetical protein HMPREF9103_00655 [Lentilactobacillus parafarraginis F0439]